MDEYKESVYFAQPAEKIFKTEPYLLYVMAFFIGTSCSAIFPDFASLLRNKGYDGFGLAGPHLIYLLGLLLTRQLFLIIRMLLPVSLHMGFATLSAAVGLFFLGFVEESQTPNSFYLLVLIGRGLMGVGNGYFMNLANHIFREEPNTDSNRKFWLQLSLVFGLTVGYPITEKVSQHTTVYWSMGGIIFVCGIAALLTMTSRKLTKILVDDGLKISLITICFKKVDFFLMSRGQLQL